MGNDMSALFQDVVECIETDNIEIKRMVLLYLLSYAKRNPELTKFALARIAQVY